MTDLPNITDTLTADHRRCDLLLTQAERTASRGDRQRVGATLLHWWLAMAAVLAAGAAVSLSASAPRKESGLVRGFPIQNTGSLRRRSS